MKLSTVILLILTIFSQGSFAIDRRIKDLTDVEHDRTNVITGLGLVTGLNATGGSIPPTREFLVSLMQRFGRPIDPEIRAQFGATTIGSPPTACPWFWLRLSWIQVPKSVPKLM